MLLPTRIEVLNVRSITHAVVEPLTDGITALAGRAGSGKSSLVNAMLWGLYGEVGGITGLLSQSEMRRADCPDEEPVEVTVDFTLNGDTYRAVRRLRRRTRAGQAVEVASAELWINGTKQPQITPSKLTDKIVSLTSLSGRAYAGAFFCAQFHLPALAEGTPAEVQRIIEDQTGLTPLTRKIDAAKSTAREAQIAADALPGSVEEVETAQAEVDEAQKDGERLWAAFETAEARAAKTRTAWEAARAEHGALTSRQRAAQQAQVKVAEVTARLEAVSDQIADLTREAESLPQVDVGQVKARATALRGVIADTQRSQHLLETAAAGLADARAAVAAAEQGASGFPDDLDAQHTQATARLAELQSEIGAVQGEYQRLDRAIDTIRASGPHTAECPTCTQRLPDAHQLLLDLIAQRDATAARGTAARQAISEAEQTVAQVAEQIRRRDHAASEHQRTLTAHNTAQTRHEAADKAAAAALTALCEVTGGDPTGAPAALVETAQQMLDTTAAQVAAAERGAQVAEQITARRAVHTDLTRTLDEARIAAADTVPDEDVIAAEARATETHAAHAVEDAARQTAETEAKVAAERARSAEAARDRAAATLDAKIEALTKADTLRHAAHMLAALRKDLLADYTATISEAATHLMQQVGGGDHVGVVIDETFVPRVVLATGAERPMRVLSGGEKMRAALCLRLGIADQIVGSNGIGMIFADEITANQDEETTQEIVDLIRNLGRPMVLIAHAPQVTQIANRVYEFDKPDETSGTTVTLAGAALPATA